MKKKERIKQLEQEVDVLLNDIYLLVENNDSDFVKILGIKMKYKSRIIFNKFFNAAPLRNGIISKAWKSNNPIGDTFSWENPAKIVTQVNPEKP